jgi:hypothetical protein
MTSTNESFSFTAMAVAIVLSIAFFAYQMVTYVY